MPQEKQQKNAMELTLSQLSMWTGQKLNPGSPLYNVVHSFDISGSLDIDGFKTSFQELIKQVDIFRIIFFEQDGIPYQSVVTDFEYSLEIIDFSTTKTREHIRTWIDNRSKIPFDMTGPLFDSVLLRIDPNRHIWYLNFHHILSDATSSTIIYQRLSKIYAHILENGCGYDEAAPSFLSYVDFEMAQQKSAPMDTIRDYWRDKVKSHVFLPKWYGRRTDNGTTRARRISLKLGKERTNSLKQLAKHPEIRMFTEHLTLFNLFATFLFIYLYRISGQEKLTIGTISHNRGTKSFKETAGLFIELFPLVGELTPEDTFATVLQRIKLETNAYLRNAQPGTTNAEISRSFNVILNYINAGFTDFNGLPMQSDWVHPGHNDPAHSLRFHVYDMDSSGEIELLFDLNEGVFDEDLMEEVPGHFLHLLDAALQRMDTPVTLPKLTTAKEALLQEQLLSTPPREYTSILEMFRKQVLKRPHEIALHCNKQELSYAQLNEQSNKLASYLKKRDIGKSKKVAIYLYRTQDYIISVLAVLKTGAAFIPISSDQAPQRIADMVSNAESSLVLTQGELYGNIKHITTPVVKISDKAKDIAKEPNHDVYNDATHKNLAYILYTSGSTGEPKGVMVSHGALSNYLLWAMDYYKVDHSCTFPLFTSVGFDLTITSTFLPLLSGGKMYIYREDSNGSDVSIMQVLKENRVNSIKLTPSHLSLLQEGNLNTSKLRTMIVGGEDFRTSLAKSIQGKVGPSLQIYNEYGPTEATVGCVVSTFSMAIHTDTSVPIGKPIWGTQAYVLDDHLNMVPRGVPGQLYIGGSNLSDGYVGFKERTERKFIQHPFLKNSRAYATGDLVRLNEHGDLEYLGRVDEQVKLNGFRIELPDVESNLNDHPGVADCAVVVVGEDGAKVKEIVENCVECGLPTNYPNMDFDEKGVCHLCNSFKGYKEKTDKYFKTEDELKKILVSDQNTGAAYDCLSLLSGGKDSTYILARLVRMGLKVLAFTLDNGYISDQAKANIDRVVHKLGVDHMYGSTPHMNKIFVDSLQRHQNVCNGCFKTIYTLSAQIALEKNIPFIVTGLSRGQFFETRLTEELFWDDTADMNKIDRTILEARKLYHQEEDAVKHLLDVSMFNDENTFTKVQFIDFYRYCDVSLSEMLYFLKEHVDWVRPTDTGRSTNCLINQLGIYVHKKEKGYSNYSFPYSWDVRLGHKTREETLEEINEVIDEQEVRRIMNEIGYEESDDSSITRARLVAYYTGKERIPLTDFGQFMDRRLPSYMQPTIYKYLDTLPLTKNGKVDKEALKGLNQEQLEMDTPFVPPRNEIEELIEAIWKEVLQLKRVGVHDNFIALGGHSLAAIRVTTRINEELEMKIPLNKIFELPTIAQYGSYIEDTIVMLMEE